MEERVITQMLGKVPRQMDDGADLTYSPSFLEVLPQPGDSFSQMKHGANGISVHLSWWGRIP